MQDCVSNRLHEMRFPNLSSIKKEGIINEPGRSAATVQAQASSSFSTIKFSKRVFWVGLVMLERRD